MSEGSHRYVLVVDGREIELAAGEVTLGRSRSSTVRVDHESVSRSHALLTLSNGKAVLKDLNSSNGTFVAGRRILNETILRPGDRLQLGAAVLEYRLLEPTGALGRTAHLTTTAAEALSAVAGAQGDLGARSDAAPEPSASAALEISAHELFREADEKAQKGGLAPVGAAAALAAVHGSGVRAEPPPVPLPPPEAPKGAPAPPVPEATLSQFPIRSDGRPSAVRPAPAPKVRRPRSSTSLSTAAEAAGLFPRLLATLVDGVILLALDLLLLSPVFLVFLFKDAFQSTDLLRDWAFLAIAGGCAVLVLGANLWYVVGGWARTGRTPGKALMRLSIVLVASGRAAPGIGLGPAFGRFLAWNLSGAVLGVGHLVALFRKDRRTMHDLLAGTRVVRGR
ncbi:MAG TPA: FHA domain-containing protein [Thermoanaerobaculia bacterium]|nr:FHA domain-containing protein [Thermoanaerobaculia bacterium]HPA51381.1 FHA domain-containing protein [Thermoanaerobaculia bacterium]HQN06951.1 FHA domain-containing protein [Thermoanaerobaculia bacterium]HQP84661.1 FHA domain-containing protein [Thermoanaerobaculia bacterium]